MAGIDPRMNTFAVASEENLIALIRKARRRLVFIGPAVTDRVAHALGARLADEGRISVTVILDADPEVYRLGYGTEAALDRLREAAARNLFDLRVQEGVRIGVVISDDVTMVFSPVPLLIEAESTSSEKPNAIVLSGAPAERLAEAAGAGPAETAPSQEIGKRPLTPAAVEAVKKDLKANPPQPFNVARAMRVFSSEVQYVEFEVENYRMSSRLVELPQELLDISDEKLREQISGRVRPPAKILGPFELTVEMPTGPETAQIDEKWLTAERKRIENEYTFIVPKFGRVILRTERPSFDAEVERFKRNLDKYKAAVAAALEAAKSQFEKSLIDEFLPRWQRRPPYRYTRYHTEPTLDDLQRELRSIVQEVISRALSFEKPRVSVVYKNVAPESVRDPKFLEPLRQRMRRRRVPLTRIESLFRTVDAAPASTGAVQEPVG